MLSKRQKYLKHFWLEKLPADFCKEDNIGRRMLNGARLDTTQHLLSSESDNWKSGFLTDNDIEKIEAYTKRRVKVDVESGEYFYKLI